jgi:hypothetical protein
MRRGVYASCRLSDGPYGGLGDRIVIQFTGGGLVKTAFLNRR